MGILLYLIAVSYMIGFLALLVFLIQLWRNGILIDKTGVFKHESKID